MKAGWKNRIEERRYFEEKKALVFKIISMKMEKKAQLQMLDEQEKVRKQLNRDYANALNVSEWGKQ